MFTYSFTNGLTVRLQLNQFKESQKWLHVVIIMVVGPKLLIQDFCRNLSLVLSLYAAMFTPHIISYRDCPPVTLHEVLFLFAQLLKNALRQGPGCC